MRPEPSRYEFLIDSYRTERLKVLSVWSMFHDRDLPIRPNPADPRGRDVHSIYGPTADTGGLAANGARLICPYPDEAALLPKAPLSGPGEKPPTERPR
ncbi:MAG: hypothetical protein ABI824_11640 [Acidobacteriota bacterium]